MVLMADLSILIDLPLPCSVVNVLRVDGLGNCGTNDDNEQIGQGSFAPQYEVEEEANLRYV